MISLKTDLQKKKTAVAIVFRIKYWELAVKVSKYNLNILCWWLWLENYELFWLFSGKRYGYLSKNTQHKIFNSFP